MATTGSRPLHENVYAFRLPLTLERFSERERMQRSYGVGRGRRSLYEGFNASGGIAPHGNGTKRRDEFANARGLGFQRVVNGHKSGAFVGPFSILRHKSRFGAQNSG